MQLVSLGVPIHIRHHGPSILHSSCRCLEKKCGKTLLSRTPAHADCDAFPTMCRIRTYMPLFYKLLPYINNNDNNRNNFRQTCTQDVQHLSCCHITVPHLRCLQYQCLQHFECRLYSVIVTQRIWMSFLNIPMLCQLPSHAWRGIEASRVTGTWERADYSWARYWRTWSSHHNSSLYPEVRNRWTSLRKCQKYVRQTKMKLIFKINYWCMLPSSNWIDHECHCRPSRLEWKAAHCWEL